MSIEIKDGRYFAAMWFVGPGRTPDGRTVDVHGALWRDPGQHWVLQYRFRYYADDRVDASSEDDKSWYRGELARAAERPEVDLVAEITRAFESMGVMLGCTSPVSVVLLQTASASAVASALASQSWTYMHFEGMTGPGGEA
jgi:hypothetical protein